MVYPVITPYALEGAYHTIKERNEVTFRGACAPNDNASFVPLLDPGHSLHCALSL